MQRGAQAAILVALVMSILPSCKAERFAGPANTAPLSKAEADTLAASLVEAVGKCDEPGLDALFDREWLLRTAAQKSGTSVGDRKKRYGMLSAEESVRRDLVCIPGAELVYLGTRQSALGQVLVIRTTQAEQPGSSANYYEFLVGKSEGGKARCLDRFDYQGGWRASTLLGAGPSAMAEAQAIALGPAPLVASGAPGAAKRVDEESKKYPESLRLGVLPVDVAVSAGDENYRQAFAVHLERYPTDLSVYLQVSASLTNRGAYALADEALVALQDGLGDEGGLLSTRVSLGSVRFPFKGLGS